MFPLSLVPMSLVARHIYTPAWVVCRFRMVSEGTATLPPLYSNVFLVSMTFPFTSHCNDVTAGTALMVHGIVTDSVSDAVISFVLPVSIFGKSAKVNQNKYVEG